MTKSRKKKSYTPRKGKFTRPGEHRYKAFAKAYLEFGSKTFQNATAAAIAAGYSVTTAKATGYKLLDYPKVQQEMERIKKSRLRRSTIAGPEEVLEALTEVLRARPSDLMGEDGVLKPLKDLPPELGQLIAGFKFKKKSWVERDRDGEETPVTEDTTEYKLVDRLRAAEMLAKHNGIYEKDNEQKKTEGPALLVAFPTQNISIEEWQAQAIQIIQKDSPAALPEPEPAPVQEVANG